MRLKLLTPAVCVAILFTVVGAQQPEYALQILSPEDGGYATGQWALRAVIVPAPSMPVRVMFTVDGGLICLVDSPPYQCGWDAGPGLKRHEIIATAQFATGRKLRAAVHTKEVDFNVNVDRVRLTVSVTDHDGRYVDGLSAPDFRVDEDDVRQHLSLCLGRTVPLDLVVAIDISGSMTDCMPALREAVKQFFRALRPDDRVFAVGFNSDPVVLAGPDSNLEARLRAVDLLEPWGMTALYDVLARSLDRLDASEPGRDARRAVVVFTDGDDTFSHLSQKEVEERAERSEASLYLIAQGTGVHRDRLKRVLQGLADKSGGRAFFPENVNKLPGVFSEVVEALAHQYLLGYEPNGDDYKWHKLRVTVQNGSYKVHARQGRRRPLPTRK